MSDEIAKLKTELEALNLKCQLARDNELRYALQRSRLEAERTRLLVKIVEAQSAPPAPSVQAAPAAQPAYAVTVAAVSVKPDAVRVVANGKPAGLPSVAQMVTTVLEGDDTPDTGMRPSEVVDVVRRTWWPAAKVKDVNPVLWRLAGKGRLENTGGRYRLNGHAS